MPILYALLAAAALTEARPTTAPSVPDEITAVLRQYRDAMEARSVEKLAPLFDPELFLFEGTHQNVGWADYRDNHIGPEMKDWSQFKVLDTRVVDAVIAPGLAYVATSSTYRIVTGAKSVRLSAAESFVLVPAEGRWRIRHLHFSGKQQ